MPHLRSGQKRQTRLTFTPLPSSSPAAKSYPDQIQPRAAAVRYDQFSSPTKKRRLGNPSYPNLDQRSDFEFISPRAELRGGRFPPTPVASSQTDPKSEQDLELVSLTSDSSSQTITPRFSTKPSQLDYIAGARMKTVKDEPKALKNTKKFGANVALPVVAGHTTTRSSPANLGLVSDDDQAPTSIPRRRARGPIVALLSSGDDSDPVLLRSNRSRRNVDVSSPMKRSLAPNPGTPSRASKQPKDLVTLSTPRLTRSAAAKKGGQRSPKANSRLLTRDHKRSNMGGKESTDDETDSQDEVRLFTKRIPRRISFCKTADEVTDEEAEKFPHPPSKASRKATEDAPIETINNDSSEDVVVTLQRRRLDSRMIEYSPKIVTDDSDEQAADLRGDLEDLRGIEIQKNRTRGRITTPKKSTKQKHLEMLRRHHAGEKTIDLSSKIEVAPVIPSPALYDKDDESQTSKDEAGDDDLDSGTEAVRQSLLADGDEYDEDFVSNDEDGTLGAPGLEEMPIEFTRHAFRKPIENFKFAVEWMVHNKLNPAFARNDKIYQIAVYKLDDEVQGYAGSKFVSAAWNDEFKKALKARPELSVIEVPNTFGHNCEACRRGGHPAKYQVIFSGKPYDRATLEDIYDENDEEDGTGSQDVQEESQAFYLGRTCNANASTAHSLHHWRTHLNFYVLNWLKNKGHLSAEKIVERENWNTKKRERYSNAVVDEMETNGEMRVLYKEFKENLEAARTARPDRYYHGSR